MASGPITSWEIDGETVANFIFLGSKITGDGTKDWFQIGKGVRQGCILSPCLFNLYAEYKMPGWIKHKLESRLLGEISIT